MKSSFRENKDMGFFDCFPEHDRVSPPVKLAGRIAALAAVFAMSAGAAMGQYPGRIQKKAEDTAPPLRATAVYEWTGDLAKPKAARLIPVAVWDGQNYQPGAFYLAQPAPLSLLYGTIYELDRMGNPQGLLTVSTAENIQGTVAGNWWVGLGTVKLESASSASARPKMAHAAPKTVKVADEDSGRPVLHRKDGGSSGSTTNAPAVDPDRPTLHRKDSSGNDTGAQQSGNTSQGNTNSTSTQQSSDSGRPTLHRRDTGSSDSSSSGSSQQSGGSSTSSTQSTDSDRPTLHRKDAGDSGSTSGSGSGSSGTAQSAPPVDPDRPTLHRKADPSSNDDSDRPTLHRRSGSDAAMATTAPIDPDRPHLRYGMPEKPEGMVEPSKLEGLPQEMNQMVAVSDAKTGEPHSFVYHWADPADAGKMQAAMEDLAKKALTDTASPLTPKKVINTVTKTTRRHTAAKTPPPAPAPELTLVDETFHAFELSYSGGATLVLTAKSTAADGKAKYITMIAQPDFYGTPQVIFKQITSDDELEATPRMRLVDAVDADADHRAELLFELRGQTTREFAIYSVVNAHVDEAFNTGPLPRIQ